MYIKNLQLNVMVCAVKCHCGFLTCQKNAGCIGQKKDPEGLEDLQGLECKNQPYRIRKGRKTAKPVMVKIAETKVIA